MTEKRKCGRGCGTALNMLNTFIILFFLVLRLFCVVGGKWKLPSVDSPHI